MDELHADIEPLLGVFPPHLNVVEFDMTMTEAVSAPRFSATGDPIDLANRIGLRTTRALQKLGYEVIREVRRYGFASVHGIRITEQGLDGSADPIHDGI